METEWQRTIRRLTKLRVDEISLVDKGANVGSKILFFKHDAGAGPVEKEEQMSLMDTRIAEMRAVDKSLDCKSNATVIAKIAESREPADIAAWQSYRHAESPGPPPAVDVRKAEGVTVDLSARVFEMRKADPTIRSYEHAVAKIAESPLASDRKLWAEYRKADATLAKASANVPPVAERGPQGPMGIIDQPTKVKWEETDAGKRLMARVDSLMGVASGPKLSRDRALNHIVLSQDGGRLLHEAHAQAARQMAARAE